MAKYVLKNLLGETLGEGYARKEAAVKAATAANLSEGEFIVETDAGVQVHPAPEGADAKVQKPKPAKEAKPAKEKAAPVPPKDLGNGYTSTQRGKQVIVRDADGLIVAQGSSDHATDIKLALRAKPTGPLKVVAAKVKTRLKTEDGATVARVWNLADDANIKAFVKALG